MRRPLIRLVYHVTLVGGPRIECITLLRVQVPSWGKQHTSMNSNRINSTARRRWYCIPHSIGAGRLHMIACRGALHTEMLSS